MTPRKLLLHIGLHEIAALGADRARRAPGRPHPPGNHDLFYSTAVECCRRHEEFRSHALGDIAVDPIVIVGAGAAGLMAAIFAASPAGPPVLLLERTADGGRKILISGGGRCNVLPSTLAPERFVTDSPRSSAARHAALVAARRSSVRSSSATSASRSRSRQRPASSSPSRIARATSAMRSSRVARTRGVDALVQHDALGARSTSGDGWTARNVADQLRASRVVLATGGLSVPATGSDGVGLERGDAGSATTCTDTYPALTPLVAAERSARRVERRVAAGAPARAGGAARRTRIDRRVPVHASRLQRAGGARRLARAGAQPAGGRASARRCACSGRRSMRRSGRRG